MQYVAQSFRAIFDFLYASIIFSLSGLASDSSETNICNGGQIYRLTLLFALAD